MQRQERAYMYTYVAPNHNIIDILCIADQETKNMCHDDAAPTNDTHTMTRMSVYFFCRLLHTIFSHFARSVTVARSSAVQASSSRRGGGPSSVAPAVAIHRLGVVEMAPSPHHCFRTVHPCAQSVKSSPTEPLLSRSSRQNTRCTSRPRLLK